MGSVRWCAPAARIVLALAVAVAVAAVGAAPAASDTSTLTNPKHFFWAGETATADSLSNDIIYHGGSAGPGAIGVETTPAVYLVYWGTEWATGFTTNDTDGTAYSSATLQNYLNTFFGNVGGSSWAGVQTQYCRNVPAGTTSCSGIAGADYVTNPKHQLKGVWTDPTPVPSDIVTLGLSENLVDDPIAMEAQRASAHFNYDLPEHGLAGVRDRGLRDAQRQREQQQIRQRRLRRLQHRRRSRVLGGGHRSGQLLLRPGRLERRDDERERGQVRLVSHPEHRARRPSVRRPADLEQ